MMMMMMMMIMDDDDDNYNNKNDKMSLLRGSHWPSLLQVGETSNLLCMRLVHILMVFSTSPVSANYDKLLMAIADCTCMFSTGTLYFGLVLGRCGEG